MRLYTWIYLGIDTSYMKRCHNAPSTLTILHTTNSHLEGSREVAIWCFSKLAFMGSTSVAFNT